MRYSVFLMLCFSFMLWSCQDHKVEINEENYVYEGEMYKLFLTSELQSLDATIQELEEIIADNQGNEEINAALEDAIESKQAVNTKLANIPDIVGFGIVPPPPPCPDGDLCILSGFQYLIFQSEITISAFTILDPQQNQVNTTTGSVSNDLPGSEGQFKYQTFELSQYSGPVSIQLSRTDAQNNTLNYTIQAFKQ